MNRQAQRIEEGGEAYQAGRDVTVHRGMSSEQMTEIMVGLARQLAFYQLDAQQTVEDRLTSFREEMLKMFAQPGRGNSEAFRDPDFQYLLNDAQTAYARSGDEVVKDTLVDIIARRSLETERSRLAVTLNDAATKIPLLTTNEFAELSLVYVLKHTQNRGLNDFSKLSEYIRRSVMPFVKDVSRENASYWHLEAQSCATIDITETTIGAIVKQLYGGLVGRGFDRTQLEGHLQDVQKNALDKFLVPCLHDNMKLQPNAVNRDVFKQRAADIGLNVAQLDNVWNLFENSIPAPDSELVSLFTPHVTDIGLLFDLWQNTPLKNLKLNSVGIAIGHANAVRVTGFDAPLGVWIK
jgi:hypothetical protein